MAQTLPPYDPPQHPLTRDMQRALLNLNSTHSLAKLKDRLDKAEELVASMAGEVNDRVYLHTEQKRRAARRAAESLEDEEEDDEEDLEELREKVDKMTERMDESIRKIIDAQNGISGLEDALRLTQTTGAATSTQALPRSQRRRRGSDDENEDVQMAASFDPTAPPATSASQSVPAPSDIFAKRVQTQKDSYYNLSLKTRYAQHNSYVSFKKIVHDAKNPGDDAPPLSHHSTWFHEEGPPAPGVMRPGATANADDSDDDVAIAREKISTKCPLTLKEFEEPVTSKKCPHSFERRAILELINANRGKGTQCPVPGCNQVSYMSKGAQLCRNTVLIKRSIYMQKIYTRIRSLCARFVAFSRVGARKRTMRMRT